MTMLLHWGDKQWRVWVLLDTSCSVPLISQQLIRETNMSTKEQKQPFRIENYIGQTVKGVGEKYTEPMILQYRHHFSRETFEVSPMEAGVDLFLPFWWITKHPPQGAWDSPEMRFSSPDCLKQCTQFETADFLLSWDEAVATEPEARIVGYVSTVKKEEEEPLENVLEKFRSH